MFYAATRTFFRKLSRDAFECRRFLVQDPTEADGGNYIVRAVNSVGEKDCTLALNFGGGVDSEENVPAR